MGFMNKKRNLSSRAMLGVQAARWFVVFPIILLIGFDASPRTVRVGVYDNPPKIEMGGHGKPRGIFIDIIETIARQERWNIQYVYGTWESGLSRLENREIDLMPDMAFSDNRNRRFDFNGLAVLDSWLQVFGKKDHAITSVSSLEGKTIVVLKGSIQEQASEEMRDRLGLSFRLAVVPDYAATVRLVESGKADAAIVSRFFGYLRTREDPLVPTPVILRPTSLHFAAPKGRNADLLAAIDRHVADMMNDPHSAYYKSLSFWLSEQPRSFVPRSLIWAMIAGAVALLFFFGLSLGFRWQVRKRTEDLRKKNLELQTALKALKNAQDEAIKRERLYAFGQMTSGIAHDLNNLLQPILNYTGLMLRFPEKLGDRRMTLSQLEAIKSSAQHGAELIRRMQAFCRSTQRPDVQDRLDLDAIIREVVDLAKTGWTVPSQSNTQGIESVLTLGRNTEILGRRSDIHEMLLNLVLNAVDAMPEGGRLEISTENREGTVAITVKDTGVGMTDEVRENCLLPFFTTKGDQGTGMGLAMVRHIVTEHGGQIRVDSKPGSGTRIIMTFPHAPLGTQGPGRA